MTNDEILAAVAQIYGIDPKEADLGLRYTAASRELAQRTTTATEDEATRLKGMKRRESLRLDRYQRLESARDHLPPRLTDKRQCDLADQLVSTCQQLQKVEEDLDPKAITPPDDLVTRANRSRGSYRHNKKRAKLTAEAETPQTSHRRNPAHLAAA